jgi:hypothetical protein
MTTITITVDDGGNVSVDNGPRADVDAEIGRRLREALALVDVIAAGVLAEQIGAFDVAGVFRAVGSVSR